MIVLGIDPGTASTGFGAIRGAGSRLELLEAGVIETRTGVSLERRLTEIHERIGALIDAHGAEAVAIEELFNYPGMGRLFIGAVIERDYAMIQALILVYGVIFLAVNLIAEIAQGVLDPRIRLQ